MQMKVELIPLPVSDVERAIAFYADQLGFTKDVDVQPSEGVRVVQLTPPGSGCSIGFGTGLAVYEGVPGSVRGVHLVVEDLDAARADLRRPGSGGRRDPRLRRWRQGSGLQRPRRQLVGAAGDGVAPGR